MYNKKTPLWTDVRRLSGPGGSSAGRPSAGTVPGLGGGGVWVGGSCQSSTVGDLTERQALISPPSTRSSFSPSFLRLPLFSPSKHLDIVSPLLLQIPDSLFFFPDFRITKKRVNGSGVCPPPPPPGPFISSSAILLLSPWKLDLVHVSPPPPQRYCRRLRRVKQLDPRTGLSTSHSEDYARAASHTGTSKTSKTSKTSDLCWAAAASTHVSAKHEMAAGASPSR